MKAEVRVLALSYQRDWFDYYWKQGRFKHYFSSNSAFEIDELMSIARTAWKKLW